jgi:DnaJ-class molecular chaperone
VMVQQCPDCAGSGRESYSVPGPAAFEHQSHEWHTRKCSTCDGSGRVDYVRQRLPCQKCGTTGGIKLVIDGRIEYATCPQCKGQMSVEQWVAIPAP